LKEVIFTNNFQKKEHNPKQFKFRKKTLLIKQLLGAHNFPLKLCIAWDSSWENFGF